MALPKSVNKKLPEEVIDIIYSFDDSIEKIKNHFLGQIRTINRKYKIIKKIIYTKITKILVEKELSRFTKYEYDWYLNYGNNKSKFIIKFINNIQYYSHEMMNKLFQNHQPENSKDWRIMNRLSKELCRTGLIKVPFFLEEDFINKVLTNSSIHRNQNPKIRKLVFFHIKWNYYKFEKPIKGVFDEGFLIKRYLDIHNKIYL